MANTNTTIEWTETTWSPTTGCTKVSPGCLHCYAEGLTRRFQHDGAFVPWTVNAQLRAAEATLGPDELVGVGITTAKFSPVTLHQDRLTAPLHWKKPALVFVDSMSDLFHEAVPDDFIADVFAVMSQAKQHTFQILTKRPERMAEWFAGRYSDGVGVGLRAGQFATSKDGSWTIADWPLPNVWLGVSVENQRYAQERIPILANIPAAIRFISAEPLLGPLNLDPYLAHWTAHSTGSDIADQAIQEVARAAGHRMGGLDWVIVGGESGPKARPMDLAWVSDIARQCRETATPVFVKQMGTRWAKSSAAGAGNDKAGDPSTWPVELRIRQFPEVAHA